MTKKIQRTGFLSNKQNIRLGGLIAVLGGREPYDTILCDLLENGFVSHSDGVIRLTDKGTREKDRLATLAGLMVEKDNAAPLPRKSTKRFASNPANQRPSDPLGNRQDPVREIRRKGDSGS